MSAPGYPSPRRGGPGFRKTDLTRFSRERAEQSALVTADVIPQILPLLLGQQGGKHGWDWAPTEGTFDALKQKLDKARKVDWELTLYAGHAAALMVDETHDCSARVRDRDFNDFSMTGFYVDGRSCEWHTKSRRFHLNAVRDPASCRVYDVMMVDLMRLRYHVEEGHISYYWDVNDQDQVYYLMPRDHCLYDDGTICLHWREGQEVRTRPWWANMKVPLLNPKSSWFRKGAPGSDRLPSLLRQQVVRPEVEIEEGVHLP